MPSVSRLLAALDEDEGNSNSADASAVVSQSPLPLTVRDAVAAIDRLAQGRSPASDKRTHEAVKTGDSSVESAATGPDLPRLPAPSGVSQLRSLLRLKAGRDVEAPSEALTCRELYYRFERDAPDVLRRLSLQVREGELLAVLGGNGAGKSTLLQLMAGLRKPQRGKIAVAPGRKLGYLAQNPMLYFSSDTVREEFARTAGHAGYKGGAAETEIARWSDAFGLGELADRHPHDLSGGQQQKLALALALLPRPDILCVDEPTKGLDPNAKEAFAALLLRLREDGMTIVMVTHDIEFAAIHADRCALLYDGEIAAAAEPPLFFGGNYFYTTSVNRAVRHRYPDAVTAEEVMRRWKSETAPS
ncbi:ABC transporter ATP-binding protein [Cohnella rhizosphaerae]|uniref:Energy-coupling factor ABC transporter ATP-binding protein n=1 Tax=Cohnella rhizosphaerae TaxID=1457232 RepID=A0A9X4L114_9BACL|nr:ABC transporter ATP-binding protein [Cohnella rhizosphaerae]MDG0811537.1 energy-coupling factor ABC transporter ATP-binding protein [Cohnella rhizosphaerae]